MALLQLKNIDITYTLGKGSLKAVDDVSFSLEKGKSLGVVGESGCGKTTIAKSIMRLLPKNGEISSGSIFFNGEDLVKKSKEEMRKYRLNEIAMISQSAMNALNPVYTIGYQITEGILAHDAMGKKAADRRAAEVFEMVGLEAKRLTSYPHQLSGGMKQRAVIAMALSLNPSLIIADEPTTALDVVVQDRILHRILQIQKMLDSSMIFITHDISVVSEVCEHIIVMYGGKIMESGSTDSFFRKPYHPYSLGLQNAFPSITEIQEELISIPGSPPDLIHPPIGCRFQERCPFAEEICASSAPGLTQVAEGHLSACHFPDRVDEFRTASEKRDTWEKVRDRIIKDLEDRSSK
jgi:peptide/nickel transport system ATP-binding protein